MMAQPSLNDPDLELHRDDEEWSTGTGSPEEFIDQMEPILTTLRAVSAAPYTRCRN